MKTVVIGPPPPELEAVIARRRALGQDTHDEVWEGDYHMAPAPHQWHGYVAAQLTIALGPHAAAAGLIVTDPFNLGDPDDYRVPDLGLHRRLLDTAFVPTAAMVVEVVSPGDESSDKFEFYAAHGVDEVLIADPAVGELVLFTLDGGRYRGTDRSRLLDIDLTVLAGAVRWPR